jgi:1-acyl-sn-glycerol-3-phosphate acyltransferase
MPPLSSITHNPALTLPTVVTAWQDLRPWDLWGWPLEALERPLDRVLTRAAAALARRQVRAIAGWERVLPACDPFILVANHGSRREALYLPAALMLARGGRPVHFLADWNFRLIPGIGYLYDGSGAITVARKEARPRWLKRFRSRYVAQTPPMEQARQRLAAGGSVAIFPEGTVNRDPHCLLRGRFGAARLSLETGVPLLPVGIRFHPPHGGEGRRASTSPMSLHVGSPMHPPGPAMEEADIGAVRAWHAELMSAIAGLSGKAWPPSGGPAAPSVPSIATERRALGAGGPAC